MFFLFPRFILFLPWCRLRRVALRCMQDALENEFPVPWETEAAFTRMLLVNAAPNGKCTFHRPDLWHTVNLGVGKTFVGGAVSVLEKAFPGRNRALRYAQLNSDYSAFCRSNHLQKYLTKIDARTFNISASEEPTGTWNKASVTSNMCRFLEHLCATYKEQILALEDDRTKFIDTLPCIQMYTIFLRCEYVFKVFSGWELFFYCACMPVCAEESGVQALNRLMHLLYNCDVWIPREMALECVRCGNHFHSSYRFLAARSREKGQMKFPLIPKIHPLEEILFLMEHQAKFSQWVLNPMVESCSLDEDFIGHAAYITRHVSPRLMALRTFNRYLTQIMLAWRSW